MTKKQMWLSLLCAYLAAGQIVSAAINSVSLSATGMGSLSESEARFVLGGHSAQ